MDLKHKASSHGDTSRDDAPQSGAPQSGAPQGGGALRDPSTGAQIRVGVMGSAADGISDAVQAQCRALGRTIAEQGCCLLTGACPGQPHEAVLGAQTAGGHVVGISPGASLAEHVATFDSPYREYDIMIYTGLGLMGRELVNIRSSDIIVVVGGRSGTLGEFAIAFEEGKLIGVLTGTGGITDVIPAVEERLHKATGAEVLYDSDPQRLIDRLLKSYWEKAPAAQDVAPSAT